MTLDTQGSNSNRIVFSLELLNIYLSLRRKGLHFLREPEIIQSTISGVEGIPIKKAESEEKNQKSLKEICSMTLFTTNKAFAQKKKDGMLHILKGTNAEEIFDLMSTDVDPDSKVYLAMGQLNEFLVLDVAIF